ncbi:probable sodium/potassium-transporting ATPase subunit beta-3 [Haliotis asinina]|uniref:probable sodium/potassium-transporting ATPase subunit beta-3 n=1 Tax=Haliotis asinina TaxID=109174 RepID=UPI003531E7B3
MAENKLTVKQKFTNFCTFLYNSETGEVLGRSGRNWGEITVFYIIYYACLAGFFSACYAVFSTTLDEHFPRLIHTDSLIRGNPGMGFRPMPDLATTLIRYEMADAKSYEPYVKHINEYLDKNHRNASGDLEDCPDGVARPDKSTACMFDLNATLAKCGEDFGFKAGKPCILLKLNKVFDWLPEPFEADSLPDNMPQSLKERYDPTRVWVTCEGENPGDNENLGEIEYLPQQGFDLKYYPYKNQKGYLSPLVFLHLANITPNVGMLIECKAWARNIWHDRTDRQGSIHFEIIVD